MDTPYSLVVVDETASTQDDARRRFAGEPVLVVAGRQTAGRGRGGAGWETAPRAMAASLAFAPAWPPPRWPVIPLVAGVAAARALDVDLKWPNDVWREGRKLGGLLVEASSELVVVGFGLNLWWPHPPDGVGAVSAHDPGPERGPQVARTWADILLGLLDGPPEAWPRDEYRRRCVTLGQEITWEPQGRGRAVDVAPDGSLVVETAEGTVRIHAGEVRHVRPDHP